ncbi:p450 domain-containing protein [Cephalotus follicularis]|uniref:p450 domain-containing protein n=1 Tax=Cephalotus follicularis TaxID=3775 RepID=A0A1Q3CAA2_CEPFO|nr:p450 domain-containing protein [Cephalotus follicularis]
MELYMFVPSLLLLLLVLSFFHRSPTRNLPPGPTGLPILGSLLGLGSHPNQSLYELSKLYGPIMTLRLGSVTTIVVSSPEAAQQVLQIHDRTFSDRYVPDVITSQPNPEATLAWVPGDHRWRSRRRICSTQLFSVPRLNSLQHLRHQKVQQLVLHIKKHCVSGSQVDIGQIAFATTLNLMSNTIFSIDIVDPEFNTAQEFKDLIWSIMEDAGKPNLSDYFPVFRRFDFQGIKRHIRSAYLRLHQVFDEIIDKRLESRKLGLETNNGDFLDVLLDQCQVDGSDFNRQTIKPLILDLFIAGSDTSAITTEWAMAELLKKPDILQKAKKELTDVIGTGQEVKESDIDRLPYLQVVVKETMRLHPAVPLLLPYKARNGVQVCGYTIPAKDTQVLVNAWAISRDPNYWNDPFTFFPERFLGTNLDYKGQDFEYIPFGAGRRICPGLPLALRMVHLMVASIINSFDWKLPEGTSPENLDMEEQFGVTLKKAVPLCAVPILEKK